MSKSRSRRKNERTTVLPKNITWHYWYFINFKKAIRTDVEALFLVLWQNSAFSEALNLITAQDYSILPTDAVLTLMFQFLTVKTPNMNSIQHQNSQSITANKCSTDKISFFCLFNTETETKAFGNESLGSNAACPGTSYSILSKKQVMKH